MGEHYPKSAVGEKVPKWCGQCMRITEHIIVQHSEHAGRLGHCVDPQHPQKGMSKTQLKNEERREKQKREPLLF